MRAIRKLTREITGLVRERVLPWYKLERNEKVKTSFSECTECNSVPILEDWGGWFGFD